QGRAGEVEGGLGLGGGVGGGVVQLGDAAVRVGRRLPVGVADLLVLALPVEPLQVGVGGVLQAGLGGQAAQVGLPVLAGVLAGDALHGGVGLQRRGVHGNGLAFEQPPLAGDHKA